MESKTRLSSYCSNQGDNTVNLVTSKTRLSSYCSNQGDNTVNLVTSHKTNARLARPISIDVTIVSLPKAR